MAGGQGGHTLPGLPGPVHLVAAPTSLPVRVVIKKKPPKHNYELVTFLLQRMSRATIKSMFSYRVFFLFFRLCGRIFCYYCSNNYVMTKHSGKKERCCRECYSQHSAVVERFTEAELSPSDAQPPETPEGEVQPNPEPVPYTPTPRVSGGRQANLRSKIVFNVFSQQFNAGLTKKNSCCYLLQKVLFNVGFFSAVSVRAEQQV